MKFLVMIYLAILPFFTQAEEYKAQTVTDRNILGQVQEAFEAVKEAERGGQGFYVATDIFGDLGVFFGHQLRIERAWALGLRLAISFLERGTTLPRNISPYTVLVAFWTCK